MFELWGRWTAAHRRLVVVLSVVSLGAVAALMVTVTPDLSTEGFIAEGAESERVDRALVERFDRGGDALVFLFDGNRPVTDPQVREAVETALEPAANDPLVAQVATVWSTGNADFVSTDGLATYAVAFLQVGTDPDDAQIDAIDAAVDDAAAQQGLDVMVGGGTAIRLSIPHQVEEDVLLAETVSVPLTLLIQVVVFGSLVAAGIPLLVGALAIVASLAVTFALSTEMFQSIFAVNVITMLGLGLGIDYSLFMVSRFREEIRHRRVPDALGVTMATVGKAITFSGIAVIFGLAATSFFPLPALNSMGQAGMVVTGMALLYGLTFLPALLALLGPRVNVLSIRRRRGLHRAGGGRVWRRVAQFVMRYPVVVLVLVLTGLLVAAMPVLRLDLTPGGPDILPADHEPRIVSDRLRSDFARGDAFPIPVLVSSETEGATSGQPAEVEQFVARLADLPGVTGAAVTGVAGDTALVDVSTARSGTELEQLVRDIRAIQPQALDVAVGGFPAAAVDTLDGIQDGITPAAIFVAVGSYLILLLAFGSVFLPLKAIFMTLLSIAGSVGIVVWVFQDGHLEDVFNFQATGEIISMVPILMFCILFGLSMDYEVLLLSRIQEEYQRTGDNRASVASGLEKTARLITGAALIMVVVFAGFMLAEIVIIKMMGFGLALAVLIDSTVVRGLLVPATMRLMGRWNWWGPRPVQRLVRRLGLVEGTEPVAVQQRRLVADV